MDWCYHMLDVRDFDASDASWEKHVVNPLFTLLAGMPGWAPVIPKVQYKSGAWFLGLTHNTGASLFCVVVGAVSVDETYLAADAWVEGVAGTGDALSRSIYLAWLRPGELVVGPGTPADEGYHPADGFKYVRVNAIQAGRIEEGTRHKFHFVESGFTSGDLMLAVEEDSQLSPSVDHLTLFGDCIFPYHIEDTQSFAQIALRGSPGVWRSVADAQFFRENGDLVTAPRSAVLSADTTTLRSSVAKMPPWPYSPVRVIDSSGVLWGSRYKGAVRTDWYRLSMVDGTIGERQRLVSGSLVHLRDGGTMGWSPRNGVLL